MQEVKTANSIHIKVASNKNAAEKTTKKSDKLTDIGRAYGHWASNVQRYGSGG